MQLATVWCLSYATLSTLITAGKYLKLNPIFVIIFSAMFFAMCALIYWENI